jgi:hypothetical protein
MCADIFLSFVNYKKGCTLLSAASDKVYQLLVHGWWFSLGTPASSTTKTGRHDIAEIWGLDVLKHRALLAKRAYLPAKKHFLQWIFAYVVQF